MTTEFFCIFQYIIKYNLLSKCIMFNPFDYFIINFDEVYLYYSTWVLFVEPSTHIYMNEIKLKYYE